MWQFIEKGLSSQAWESSPFAEETMEYFLADKNLHWAIARHVLSKPWWAKRKEAAGWMARIIAAERADGDVVWHALSIKEWAAHPKGPELLSAVAKLGHADSPIYNMLQVTPYWRENEVLRKACGGVPTLECLKKISLNSGSDQSCRELLTQVQR
jgi:hypothetical protein